MIFDARINILWNRRSELSEAEWTELYGIVHTVLHQRNFSLLKSLSDDRDDYINSFFIQKVMPTKPKYDPASEQEMLCNKLVGYFKNFLKDQLDSEKRKPSNVKNNVSFDDPDAHWENIFPDQQASEDGGDTKPNGRWASEFTFSPDAVEETLANYQLTRLQLTESARDFFGYLQDWQQQVLNRHLCPEHEYALPLSQLQEQYPQTATYYKVKQLGIVHSLRTLPMDYHKTEIGRWLTQSLGLELNLDNYAVLNIALQILCLVALRLLDD